MKVKLILNNHKVHWSNCNNGYLLHRLREEVKELDAALRDFRFFARDKEETRQAVIKECADVANFAMMIADNMANKVGENNNGSAESL